jgi:hypothetical protein
VIEEHIFIIYQVAKTAILGLFNYTLMIHKIN